MDEDTIVWLILGPLVGVMLTTLTIGFVLMVRDTVRQRGNWGINWKPVRCPECGVPAPAVRIPQNRRQTLWGGATCTECGVEYDKWGREVEERT